MRRVSSLAALITLSFCTSLAQQNAVVTLKAALVDSELHVRPVPKLLLTVSSVPAENNAETKTSTNLEGVATLSLPPGKYKVITPNPMVFQGKNYSWEVAFDVTQGSAATVELSNDNANVSEAASTNTDKEEQLRSAFKAYRDSVVTVFSEFGRGTGFFIDSEGIVLTNHHVVGTSQILSVQIDEKRKLSAVLLGADSEKDIAVLWVNTEKIQEVKPVKLWQEIDPVPQEGDTVFTIGSPLHQRKVITTGIVSKVEERAIISDININHGNSGGPLFDRHGTVIGVTTFGDTTRQGGPGISGIVRIQQAFPIIERAKKNLAIATKPSGNLLPVDPTDRYPVEAIKEAANVEKFNIKPYMFGVGDYEVSFITPIVHYSYLSASVKAGKAKEKRNKKSTQAVQGTFEPLEGLYGWEEYVGEYEPVLLIEARPRLKEGFWSAIGRGMAANYGTILPANLHFKTDFYQMKLFCGKDEIQPIQPGKLPIVLDEHNALVNVTDATFAGLYKYPANSINQRCGTVELHLFSEKDPANPKIKVLEEKTVSAITADFSPYLERTTDNSAK